MAAVVPSGLSTITLTNKFVYKYGDRPYFAAEINESETPFFIRYKVSETEYKWSRVKQVVTLPSPFTWMNKRFMIRFQIDEDDSLVPVESLTQKPVEDADILRYTVRMSGNSQENSAENVSASELDFSKFLPDADTIAKSAATLRTRIEHRAISMADKLAIEEYTSKLNTSAYSGGYIAAKHTVTVLGNLQTESQTGRTTSFHQTGFSTRAHERRLADASQTQTSPHSSLSQPASQEYLTSPSQATMEMASQSQSVLASQSVMSVLPDDNSVSARRWEQATKDESLFTEYLTNPDRTSFLTRLASRTKENTLRNAIATLAASGTGKQRTSNMVESSGLWITDDVLRNATAKEHQAAEEEKRGGGEKKKEETKKSAAPAAPAVITAEAAPSQPISDPVIPAATQSLSQQFSQEVDEALLNDLNELAKNATSPMDEEASPPLTARLMCRYASMSRSGDDALGHSPLLDARKRARDSSQ